MSRSTATSSWESWKDGEQDEIKLFLAQELDENILEIDADLFFRTFLGSQADAWPDKCLDALKNPDSDAFKNTLKSQIKAERSALKGSKHPDGTSYEAISTAISQRLPTYDQDTEQFRHLADAQYEDPMYEPLCSLLNFINHFYRNHLGIENEIDKEWPEATQTWPLADSRSDGASSTESELSTASESPSQLAPLYLRRRFVVPPGPPRYTKPEGRDSFRPDLALVLLPSENPQPPDPLGWKDIKVAIEVKRDVQTPHLQAARYARCIKLEQFDRNFIFTLTITGRTFRVARWDSAACYVTPLIDFHENPLSLIRVVGRLASMSPTDLGYDPAFSNAGRVLYSQAIPSNGGIRTILTITPCQVNENLQECPRTPAKEPVQYLLDDDMLCDARDFLFCRSTKVWKAQLIIGSELSPEYNAIKQNWHDETRTNEAWFYEEMRGIQYGISHMIYFEDLCRTRDASLPIEPHHVHATWTRTARTSDNKVMLERKELKGDVAPLDDLCHRVLVRIVLQEVGRPLSELKTPRQLVHVVRDIAVALKTLYDHNILHRDISEGNILLSADENPVPGHRAFLTDFGLAMRIDPTTKLPPSDSVEHNHITGTLPFMAAIFVSRNHKRTPLSMIHHDVESLFWVAMYAVFRCASRERSENTPEEELDVITECKGRLERLRSSDIMTLYAIKKLILSFDIEEVRLPGRWLSIRNFLSKLAALCTTKHEVALANLSSGTNPDPQNHDVGAIVSEADAVDEDSSAGLDEPAPRGQTSQLPVSGSLSAPQHPGSAERTTSTSNRIKRSRNNDDANYQGRRGGVPGPRERSKRIRTGANSQE